MELGQVPGFPMAITAFRSLTPLRSHSLSQIAPEQPYHFAPGMLPPGYSPSRGITVLGQTNPLLETFCISGFSRRDEERQEETWELNESYRALSQPAP
jgi:hypothetical protein